MNQSNLGGLYALAAMTIWGIAPVYFVAVGFAQPIEVLAHRIFWSVPLLCLIVSLVRDWPTVIRLSAKEYLYLFASAMCLAVNWLAFIIAISEEKIVETSLGYFINPLISIFLGWIFLREHLTRLQWCAVLVAIAGISWELYIDKLIPVYGLSLAISFGVYGLLRKQVNLPAATGLLVECCFLLPLVLLYVLFFSQESEIRTQIEFGLLMFGGVMTVIPLLFFTAATTRLPLVVLGVFQYLAPSLSLIIAILAYDEPVSSSRWTTLWCVWMALVIFSVDGFYRFYQSRSV
jgi:chloramphenicol-sensitive protein RarD